ncbi:MAG: sugar phosphate nucleotidyltransferase [Rickettsiaceae bacterium]
MTKNNILINDTQVIILAAGMGKRMKSQKHKVLHLIGARTMLDMVISNVSKITNDIILVQSKTLSQYTEKYSNICEFAIQEEALGTAHAIFSGIDLIDPSVTLALIYGDHPFIKHSTIKALVEHLQTTKSSVVTLAFNADNPNAYGRIVTDKEGQFVKIVESQYASQEESKITLCNSGIMAFAPGVIHKYLAYCLVPNSQKNINIQDIKNMKIEDLREFGNKRQLYITDIIDVCKSRGEMVSYMVSQDANEVIGINTQDELKSANKINR